MKEKTPYAQKVNKYSHVYSVLPVESLTISPRNPRKISEKSFLKLVDSLKTSPWMLEIRPIVATPAGVVLAGNQRLKAAKAAGLCEIPVITVNGLTEDQYNEFLIRDNTSAGEWDWEILNDEYDLDLLVDWGVGIPIEKSEILESGEKLKEVKHDLLVNCAYEGELEGLYRELKDRGFKCKKY